MQDIFPFHPFKYLRKLLCDHNEVEERQQADWGARPEPLPTQTRRVLTLPSSPSAATQSNTENPIYHQEQSQFFANIPLEIRLLVYQEVLAPSDYPILHVASGDGRLLSRRCFENDPRHPSWCHKCSGRLLNRDGTIIPIYRTTTYDPVVSANLGRSLISSVPSYRNASTAFGLYSCRSLFGTVEFTRWNDWPFEFQQDDDSYPDWNEVIQLLEPMKAIRVPNFVLTLFWYVDQAEISRAVGDAAPFRVEFKEHHGRCYD
ncbi:uncharacterized protein N7446_013927 [Penicillium canescens]|uniref:DUF7730 domain-containing protein n=1 Tax=Penicillium canescens TaxID=5083 RepID=A0AAD6N2J3_PENCN|nr:uncharacterized protein N7446_013927 [Penicillium canescens]KAJ6023562.1 hypothetical protein N7460_013957 [Penicillium canescens]KAJ6042861.1 hypothetical protein N7446_013927 [Penicillium canescens]